MGEPDQGEPDGDFLRDVFKDVFRDVLGGREPKPFGDRRRIHTFGFHDGNTGVQWNTGIEPIDDTALATPGAFLGVNIEGMKCDGWPIARLIASELRAPKLFTVLGQIEQGDKIELWWGRDAWHSRPASEDRPAWEGRRWEVDFKEHTIERVQLSNLNEATWRSALREAWDCLNHEPLGRGWQTITLKKDNRRVSTGVSPHLRFRWRLWLGCPSSHEAGVRRMAEGRKVLEPLHAWATAAAG